MSFTVLIDFVNHLMPQSAATSDIDISSSDGLNSIDNALAETLRGMNGVKQVYGRRGSFDIPAERDTGTMVSSTVDLVSFDDFDLDCLKKDGALVKAVIFLKSMETVTMRLQLGIKTVRGKLVIKSLSGMKKLKLPVY